jgi:hypothetical protein
VAERCSEPRLEAQPMRVSFDSNAWERIFTPADTICAPIRAALANGAMAGFICETGFRIEAITKVQRASYFTQPYMDRRYDGVVMRDGREYVQVSFGPDDTRHPGLPSVQAQKLQRALSAGVLLMRGSSFMGLAAPREILNPQIYVPETTVAAREREQRQIDVMELIEARSVGKAAFDALGGWSPAGTPPANDKKFFRACAEWADAELVAAHIAHKHDILCTNDRARSAGTSVFDAANRGWLTAQFGVVFKTVDELIAGTK